MTGKLTTHVLNTAQGCPARNMAIELWSLPERGERQFIKRILTNAEGRTDEPLLANREFQLGVYELIFAVGDYFSQIQDLQAQNAQTQGSSYYSRFLDQVPIRFGIADPLAHYHVPLLVSPWAYSTYRGS
jgi:5-hydroxyisourate hydrolase